jgi:hypothetical protein
MLNQELLAMLTEIEGAIRRFRLRLEEYENLEMAPIVTSRSAHTERETELPEVRRLKILQFVRDRSPVEKMQLWRLADELKMGRQGLGGFFRKTEVNIPGIGRIKSSLLLMEGTGRYATVSLGDYGQEELRRLQSQFPEII